MRKTLSFVLTVAFILSTLACAIIPIGAQKTVAGETPSAGEVPAGYTPKAGATAVKNSSDFANMEPGGDYYLEGDITVDESYAQQFVGSFDGCGHKITISVPLFVDMSGEFKNAVIEGTAVGSSATSNYSASVTAYPKGTAYIENVCNNATISGDSTCGGIVGYAKNNSDVTIKNCVNNGNVTAVNGQTGGIIGYSQGTTLTISNCVNNGDIDAGKSYGAGIAGRFGKDDSGVTYICKIESCVNNGDVKCGKDQGGGILGYLLGLVEITNCVNTGNVTSPKATGGIAGQSASTKKEYEAVSALTVKNCVNAGRVEGATRAGGIVATLGRLDAAGNRNWECLNCVNFGEVVLNLTEVNSSSNGAYTAGGIVAYAWGGGADKANTTQNCVNFGNVTVTTAVAETAQTANVWAAGILGYYNSISYNVKDNANLGTVSATGIKNPVLNEICFNMHASGADDTHVSGNMALAKEGVTYQTNGEMPDNHVTITKEADVASGKLAFELNERAGKRILFQKLGTDELPTYLEEDDGSNNLVKEGDVIKNGAPPAEQPTEQPTEKPTDAPTEKPTDAPTEAPTDAPTDTKAPGTNAPTTEKPEEKGGCKSAVVSALGVVAVACVAAVALKKKH